MSQSSTPEFELVRLGIPVRNFRDAIQSGLFANGIMDVFVGGEHYRFTQVRFEVRGGNINGNAGSAQWLRRGEWRPAPEKRLEITMNPGATVIALHDSVGKLLFVACVQQTNLGFAKIVLYRSGSDPNNLRIQITEWNDGAPKAARP